MPPGEWRGNPAGRGDTWQPLPGGGYGRGNVRDHRPGRPPGPTRGTGAESWEDAAKRKAAELASGAADWFKKGGSAELLEQSGKAGGFADTAQGQFLSQGDALRAQLGRQMSGQESLSGEQLRQGLQQNVAAQQSMAAGARGGNQAMAARQGQMNAANLGAGLAGQQAMAGIAERQAAASGLGALRGQDLQATLGGRGQAIQGYGITAGDPSNAEKAWNVGKDVLQMYAASDVRLKTDIGDGSTDARELIRSLTPQAFRYRDADRNGAGEHVGIMAQDLERTPAGRSMVADTPGGKQIDGGKLATGLAAVAADLDRRVADIERRGLDDIERRQSPARVGRRADGGYLGPTSARTENERVLRLVGEGMRSGMGGRR